MILLAAEEGPGFHVPGVTELFEFVPIATFELGGLEFRITFPILLLAGVTLLLIGLFVSAFSNPRIVPSGLQNTMEVGVEQIREQIVLPTIGPEGDRYMPFLTSMFFFIFFLNVLEVIPPVNFPVTSHMAFPTFLALLSLLIFNFVGMKEQGPIHYFRSMLFPPGVPKPIYIILTPVEFMSTMIFRPLTLAVRLFANMMAGHVMLAVFFLASAYFLYRGDGIFLRIMTPGPVVMSVLLIGFEIFISLIQAFIFTILTAVYIAGAIHPEH